MLKVAIMVSGGGTNLQAIIDAVESGNLTGVELSCVISNKADAYALTRAENAGIEALCLKTKDYPDKEAYGDKLISELESRDIDLVVLAGFLVILPENFTKAYSGRIINIHPSLIPSFCGDGFYGLKVHEEALKRGVKVTGATVHFVNEECDGGPIIAQKAVYIQEGDTAQILQRRVMEEAEWILLPMAIQAIADNRIEIIDNIAHVKETN